MLVQVLKPFQGPQGRVFQVGEVHDASKWRTTAQLVRQRYCQYAEAAELLPIPESSPYGVREIEAAPEEESAVVKEGEDEPPPPEETPGAPAQPRRKGKSSA